MTAEFFATETQVRDNQNFIDWNAMKTKVFSLKMFWYEIHQSFSSRFQFVFEQKSIFFQNKN